MKVAFPTIPTAPITQVFNNYNPALYGGDHRHKGIDYGILPNNPVYACMDGIVSVATNGQTGYGRHIRIQHDDGSLSIYGHLNKLLVSIGDMVEAGQEIGKSGGDPRDGVDGDGLSTGAHLHFEIRPPGAHGTDQSAVDPEKWLLQYIPAEIRTATVTAYSGLNVRSKPDANAPKTRYNALQRRETVQVVELSGKWARLRSVRPEWCFSDWLEFTGEAETVEGAPVVKPELTDAEKLERLWQAHPELW